MEMRSLGIIDCFKDSNFVKDRRAGHPRDSSNELYASAFAACVLRKNRFWEKYGSTLTEEQRKLVTEIFRFVEKRAPPKPDITEFLK